MKEILIVVRSESYYKLKKKLLLKPNVRVLADPIKALNQVDPAKQKYIVVDSGLTKVSCFDLIDIIRSNPLNHHIKIIIATRSTDRAFLEKAYCLGTDHFIKYPINVEEIDNISNFGNDEFSLEFLYN